MIYQFESYSIDPDRRELRRGADLVALEPQVFDVLEYLVRNRERIVGKEDLIAGVWDGRIVSDSTLTSRIAAARQAIGGGGTAEGFIRTIPRRGYRFIGSVHEAPSSSDPQVQATGPTTQKVTFCRTGDGINLAVANVGAGPVIVRTAHWVTSLEYDWESPITGPLLKRLATGNRLVRYDGRGTGLSDRNVSDISLSTFLLDLETVVESLQLERVALLGISGGAATALAYAVRYPHRVSKLVLFGGYALGRSKRGTPQDAEEATATLEIMRRGWGDERSAFFRAFSTFFVPSGTAEEIREHMNLVGRSTTGDNVIKIRRAVDEIDVLDLLPGVSAPTMIFHCRRDHVAPFEQGRVLAALIPNAKFVALESDNHALLAREPAWSTFVDELGAFLTDKS